MCRFLETNRGETVVGGASAQLIGEVNQSQLLLQ